MAEAIVPPWVRPESPETLRIIDDATVALRPAFGRGMTQRGIWADPRWGLRRRYRGLRSDEKAAILHALNETRGQLNVLRITPHSPLRGSFPVTELISNNTFGSGTTGWSASGSLSPALSVSDRVARLTLTAAASGAAAALSTSSSIAVTQYAAYVVRAFFSGERAFSLNYVRLGSSAAANTYGETSSSTNGMLTLASVPYATSVFPTALMTVGTSNIAGDVVEIPYMTLARCPLVDAGSNYLLFSDAFDASSWTKSAASVSPDVGAAFDGSTTADRLIENSATASHGVDQVATVSSAAADWCFGVAVKANGRNFVQLQIVEGTGPSAIQQYFNLGTGAVGVNGATGANWADRRAFIVALGNSWYGCYLIGRKTNAATSLDAYVIAASADGTNSYLGDGSSGLILSRGTLAQSSVPMRLATTGASSMPSGTTPSGNGMFVKGLPVSTSGLLLRTDWAEVASELKQTVSPLSSDAVGLGYWQFRPALAGSPANNDPVVVHEPFGRFIYPAGVREIENLFGVYADCSMELEEVYV